MFIKEITQNCNILWFLVCWSLLRDLRLDFNLLLALGIVAPNVNRSFKSKLAEELQKGGATLFLDIGTCSIHIANNAFLEGIKCLKDNVNVDQFAIDLIFLFQTICSRSRRLYLIDVSTQCVIKHCQTRWLILDKMPLGIIEQ